MPQVNEYSWCAISLKFFLLLFSSFLLFFYLNSLSLNCKSFMKFKFFSFLI